jgi:hypothetical protein
MKRLFHILRRNFLGKNEKSFLPKDVSFKMERDGRCGNIIYRDGDRVLKMYWEISAVRKYDILLAPIDLRQWGEPGNEKIDQDEQLEILDQLRSWLQWEGIKSNIDRDSNALLDTRSCVHMKCNQPRIKGVAYCRKHFDINLLRN